MVNLIKDNIALFMSNRNDTIQSMLYAIRASIVEAADGKREVDDKLADDFERRLQIAEEMCLKVKTAHEIYKSICEIEKNEGC